MALLVSSLLLSLLFLSLSISPSPSPFMALLNTLLSLPALDSSRCPWLYCPSYLQRRPSPHFTHLVPRNPLYIVSCFAYLSPLTDLCLEWFFLRDSNQLRRLSLGNITLICFVCEHVWGRAGGMACSWMSEDNLKDQCAPSAMWVLEDQTQDAGLWQQEALRNEPTHKPGVCVLIHFDNLCQLMSLEYWCLVQPSPFLLLFFMCAVFVVICSVCLPIALLFVLFELGKCMEVRRSPSFFSPIPLRTDQQLWGSICTHSEHTHRDTKNRKWQNRMPLITFWTNVPNRLARNRATVVLVLLRCLLLCWTAFFTQPWFWPSWFPFTPKSLVVFCNGDVLETYPLNFQELYFSFSFKGWFHRVQNSMLVDLPFDPN